MTERGKWEMREIGGEFKKLVDEKRGKKLVEKKKNDKIWEERYINGR